MPLTPNDIVSKQFGRKARGYSVEEVDSFLDEVEAELSRLLADNARLTRELAAAKVASSAPAAVTPAAPAPAAAPAAAPGVAPHETQEAALRTLLMAQRTADQAIAEARAEADGILSEATSKAARTDQELNARIHAARAALEAEQKDVVARVEDLKAYEREYRMRLRAYLEGQLRELESRGGGEGPGAGVPAASRTAAVGTMPPGVTDAGAARSTPPVPPVAPPVAPRPAPLAAPPVAAPPMAAPHVAAPPATPSVAPPVARPAAAPPVAPLPAPAPAGPPPGAPPAAPPVAPPSAAVPTPSEPFVLDDGRAPSGPPRQAPAAPGVGPFTSQPRNPLEQIDEGPEPPAQA